jgi:hypothetical protein
MRRFLLKENLPKILRVLVKEVFAEATKDELEWKNVLSSNIQSIAYDDTLNILYIRFLSGYTYYYAEVPPNVWYAFKNTPGSFGKWFHRYIRNQYEGGRARHME